MHMFNTGVVHPVRDVDEEDAQLAVDTKRMFLASALYPTGQLEWVAEVSGTEVEGVGAHLFKFYTM